LVGGRSAGVRANLERIRARFHATDRRDLPASMEERLSAYRTAVAGSTRKLHGALPLLPSSVIAVVVDLVPQRVRTMFLGHRGLTLSGLVRFED